jgi:hypothetical protein
MNRVQRALRFSEMKAEPPEAGERGTLNEDYILGWAARSMDQPYDPRHTQEWRRGWLDSDEHICECEDAEHLLNRVMQQMGGLGYGPAEIIERAIDFFEVELDEKLIDEILGGQPENAGGSGATDGLLPGSQLIH